MGVLSNFVIMVNIKSFDVIRDINMLYYSY